jgi:acyl-coenzyme A synthetase/AMP-(fatty) acid ligase
MRRFGVTNFAGAPTMYRAMSKAAATGGIPLRRASSAGEPLTPDVAGWAETTFGVPIGDHYGQTSESRYSWDGRNVTSVLGVLLKVVARTWLRPPFFALNIALSAASRTWSSSVPAAG